MDPDEVIPDEIISHLYERIKELEEQNRYIREQWAQNAVYSRQLEADFEKMTDRALSAEAENLELTKRVKVPMKEIREMVQWLEEHPEWEQMETGDTLVVRKSDRYLVFKHKAQFTLDCWILKDQGASE